MAEVGAHSAGRDASRRSVRPLDCYCWGKVWTLAAWCETRKDFRIFRVDRIDALEVLPGRFRDEPGKMIADLLRHIGEPPDGVSEA